MVDCGDAIEETVALGTPTMSGLSDGFEECEEARLLVTPDIPRHLGSREPTQAVGLHLQIRLHVSMCRDGASVPEIERDDFERDSGLQQSHGAIIAKAMRRDAAALEARAL